MKTTFILLSITVSILSKSSNFTLRYVEVFFRHGSRTPDLHELYPNDPHVEELKNAGLGQLTEDGKYKSCKLGRALRNRYKNFLENAYNENEISVQTTISNRTHLTAQLVLNGLFDQPCFNNSGTNYNISSKPYELSLVRNYCPAYLEDYHRLVNTTKARKVLKDNENFFQHISLHSGHNYSSTREVLFLYETLHSERTMNFTLPPWAEEKYEQIETLAVLQLKYESNTKLLKTLNGGRMLKKVMEHMKNKIQDTPQFRDKRITLYSGHDFNIAAILSTLNLFDPHFPQFNSAVALELYQHLTSKEYFVKIVYFKDVHQPPQALKLPRCSMFCIFSKFEKKLSPYIPNNYTEECNSKYLLD